MIDTPAVAAYLRISQEDDVLKDESNSIGNQRTLVRGFIGKQSDLRNAVVVEYIDDGASGETTGRAAYRARSPNGIV